MFAINHAAAALLFKKKFPTVKMLWLLISVQLVEFLWVIFNYLGYELTTTEKTVRYVGDIHLIHMPFSHSLLTTLILSLFAYFVISKVINEPNIAIAVSLAIASHFILDLITHTQDLAVTYFALFPKIGSTLYTNLPYIAFIVELGFGVFCWWYFKGSKGLLFIIVIFNLSNFTLFSPDIIGLEAVFAGRPTLLVTVILFQIIITLMLVGYFSKSRDRMYKTNLNAVST